MAKVSVTYNAPEGDNKVVETHGLTFYHGQPVDLDDEEHKAFLAKAKDNMHFFVGEGRKKPGPKPKGDEPKADEPAAD